MTPENIQQLYSYQAFADLCGCARQTIYNLVSERKLSSPIKTLAGPRFTLQHYLEFVGQAPSPAQPVMPAPRRGRGRPRIVAQRAAAGGVA